VLAPGNGPFPKSLERIVFGVPEHICVPNDCMGDFDEQKVGTA